MNYKSIQPQWYLQNPEKGENNLAELVPDYTFSYNLEIKSKEDITFVGAPEEATSVKTPDGFSISTEKSSKIPIREIKIYYKTNDMFKPQLKY